MGQGGWGNVPESMRDGLEATSVDEPYALRLSVIVPVYNKASVLETCISSLDAQTASPKSFEVILVNDGSTDGSFELCKRVAGQRSNYVLLDQENGGVSAARNAGMRVARGERIMFLDADDAISPETIEALLEACDALGDTVDLISYPIAYCDLATGDVHGHRRQRWLTETRAYALADVPYVAQSTINVCVRNDRENPIYFREDLRMGEDQWFCTEWLARKAMIGNCADALYLYSRYEGSASSKGNDPQYAFEDMMALFQMLLELAQRDERMRAYAYSLLLYNVSWRLREGKFFPEFGSVAERRRNRARLDAVIRSVPLSQCVGNPCLGRKGQLQYLALRASIMLRSAHTGFTGLAR